MKIRNGFVSNSSSTSFCVIYQDTTIKDIDKDTFSILSKVWDGTVIFKPTKEAKEYLKENYDDLDVTYINILFNFDEGFTTIKSQSLIDAIKEYKNVKIFSGEGSINYPYDLNTFIDFIENMN